jgi:hypothetical protein
MSHKLSQLTIRGFGPLLEERVRALAKAQQISLNKAALILLRRGAGLAESPGRSRSGLVGDALDSFVGVWSAADEREFLDALSVFEQVDPELWS